MKKWLTPQEHKELIAEVEAEIEKEREIAVNSPMPKPESAEGGVYCEDGCHEIKPKYGIAEKCGAGAPPAKGTREAESALHFK